MVSYKLRDGRSVKNERRVFLGYRIKLRGQDFAATGIIWNPSFVFLPFYLSKILTSLFFQGYREYSFLQQNVSLTTLLKC